MPATVDRADVANFTTDMADVVSDIRDAAADDWQAYYATDPHIRDVNGEYNRYYEDIGAGSPSPADYFVYDYVTYRNDVDALARKLERFIDDARPDQFDVINERLLAAKDLLLEAPVVSMGSIMDVYVALGNWEGGAAQNFRDTVLAPFAGVMLRQANLAKQIAMAALAYQYIIESARGDALDIASQLKKKVTGGGAPFDLGTALFIIGAVASGVALATGGPVSWPAVIAFAANTARAIEGMGPDAEPEEYAFTGLEAEVGGGPAEDRVVTGLRAMDFIPSTDDLITKIWLDAPNQEEIIFQGLKNVLSQADDSEGTDRALEFRRPDLTEIDRLDELGVSVDSEVTIGNLAQLRRVAITHLPAAAQKLHEAHLKVAGISGRFDSGLGDTVVVGRNYGLWFKRAVDRLDTAITEARDFLYDAGRNLTAVVDDYYETDQAMHDQFEDVRRDLDLADDVTFQDWVESNAEDYPLDIYRPATTGYY